MPTIEQPSDLLSRQNLLVRGLGAINEFYTRHFHELSVLTPCTLPASGPAILVCNHTAGVDPLLIQSACPRLIVWMMAKEYYEMPGLRWAFVKLGMIPVERSGKDTAATRAALRALEAGRILGVFPEGRIEPAGELLPFQIGVGLLAVKTQAPVYPAYLDGTQRNRTLPDSLLRPSEASVAFGGRVELDVSDPGREGLERVTRTIQAAVQGLKDRAAGR